MISKTEVSLIEVVTTTGKREDAERIAALLVERRLAACAQVSGPIDSYYRWQGKVERDREWRCSIKTTSALYGRVEEAILEVHPYELPQVIALPVLDASSDYARWLEENTGP